MSQDPVDDVLILNASDDFTGPTAATAARTIIRTGLIQTDSGIMVEAYPTELRVSQADAWLFLLLTEERGNK